MRRLWLLPSGPDQVHHPAMRGDPPREILPHQPPPRRKECMKSSMNAASCSGSLPAKSMDTARRGNASAPNGKAGSGRQQISTVRASCRKRHPSASRWTDQPANRGRNWRSNSRSVRVITYCGTLQPPAIGGQIATTSPAVNSLPVRGDAAVVGNFERQRVRPARRRRQMVEKRGEQLENDLHQCSAASPLARYASLNCSGLASKRSFHGPRRTLPWIRPRRTPMCAVWPILLAPTSRSRRKPGPGSGTRPDRPDLSSRRPARPAIDQRKPRSARGCQGR